MITDVRKVRLALELLGETPEEVAGTLEGMGIKGHRGMPDCCVVANYLAVCGVEDPMVDPHGTVDFCPYLTCRLPGPVRELVDAFDYGAFPSLDQEITQ